MALVTLEEAKKHLAVDYDAFDDLIQVYIDAASSLCLEYLKLDQFAFVDSSFQPLDVPYYLRAAVLIWVGILFKNREGKQEQFGYIPTEVSNILYMYRQPTYR